MSEPITKELLEEAVSFTHTAITAHKERWSPNGWDGLHIVIGVPLMEGQKPKSLKHWCEKLIMYEESFRDEPTWTHPYKQLARRKAYVSYRHGITSKEVIDKHQKDMAFGDPIWYGSAIAKDLGIIVGVSGVDQQFDHMLAHWIVEAVRALLVKSGPSKIVFPNDGHFILGVM